LTFPRITVNPLQMGGVPCIRGRRLPVATVVEMVADGMTRQEILQAYPDLEGADIDEALRFAATAVRERQLPLVTVTIPDANWRDFEAWAKAPAKSIASLADLAGTRPAWQD